MTRRGKGPSSQRAWFAERGVPKTCNYGPDVHQAVPPAASHQPARSVSSVSLFAFFSPSSPSSSSFCLYLCRPVRASFFLTSSSFFGARLLVRSSVFFSLLSLFRSFCPLWAASRFDSDSGPPYLTLPPIRVQRTLRFLFYFTLLLYLLTHSRFLSASPPRFFHVSFFLSASAALFSFSRLRLLCRQSRLATWNCPKNTVQQERRTRGRRDDERHFSFLFFFFLLSFFRFPSRPLYFFLSRASRHLWFRCNTLVLRNSLDFLSAAVCGGGGGAWLVARRLPRNFSGSVGNVGNVRGKKREQAFHAFDRSPSTNLAAYACGGFLKGISTV